MSSFTVHLNDDDEGHRRAAPQFTDLSAPRGRFKRILLVVVISVAAIACACGLAGYLYYRSLTKTPQYSLALIVDAAKRDDKQAIGQLVDIDAVVDDFLPQITDKAVEMYGRGLPPQTIQKLAQVAQPILPAVKERAKAELPRVIRNRTQQFGYVPFFAMVLGADKYLNISVEGDNALVTSKVAERRLEMKMHRNGERWQIVGVKDEQVATDIARTVGQQIITIASKGLNKKSAETLGVGNLADLLKQAEELIK